MRNELSLIVVVLLLLMAEIFSSKNARYMLLNVATGLFALHTILGFVPAETGELFGGMYRSTPLIILMKNTKAPTHYFVRWPKKATAVLNIIWR